MGEESLMGRGSFGPLGLREMLRGSVALRPPLPKVSAPSGRKGPPGGRWLHGSEVGGGGSQFFSSKFDADGEGEGLGVAVEGFEGGGGTSLFSRRLRLGLAMPVKGFCRSPDRKSVV